MGARVVLLGTGTCQLEPERAASSALIEVDGRRLVFDFGRGVAHRLVELGLRQDDLRHVVLSHFHPDHFTDLLPYLQAGSYSRIDPRTEDLTIYGPPGLTALFGGLVELIGRQVLVDEKRFLLHLRELRAGRFSIDGLELAFHELPPAGNHGLRFTADGWTVALTGDSGFHPAAIEFLRGADLAVIDSGHLSDEEIVELAVASGARRIVCSHLYRELDAGELDDRARRRGFTGRLAVARDLMRFAPR